MSGNSTAGQAAAGGGILTWGAVTLTQSTVNGNSTAGNYAGGGGIWANLSVTLTQSTVSGNSTMGNYAQGGGIGTNDLMLTQSTVSGNNTAGVAAHGGGIFALGSVALIQSTVTANHAFQPTAQGDGVFQFNTGSGHPISISGSIVAGNPVGGGADLVQESGNLTVNYSLIGTGIVPTAGSNNVVTNNPQLGSLANNGGLTRTHALLATSPAIDAGDPAAMAGVGDVPLYDQRGAPFTRVAGGRIDIGAYERQTLAGLNLVVDTAADVNDGNYSAGNLSLREAIGLANGSVGADEIAFAAALSAATITLGGSEFLITEALTIDARPLAAKVTINANQQSRIFNITATTGDITLAGLTLTGGRTIASSSPGPGGAIRSLTGGNLTLDQSIVSGNSTVQSDGGGVYARGSVALIQSTVSGNSTEGSGAGGGGVYARGSVALTQSTVSGNSTAGGFGHGGGVFASSSVTLIQSTISGNSTAGGSAHGGGIFALGSVALIQSTVTENRALYATAQGGGVFQSNTGSDHPISISGSIVAGNTATGGGADLVKDPASTLTVNYSLIGTGITPTTGGNNVVTDNPQLGALANNGGLTRTHALLATSPAIDAGDPAALAGVGDVPLYDQRGQPFSRVADGDGDSIARIDIGAYEQRLLSFFVDTLADESDGDYSAGDLSLREAISLAFGSIGALTFSPSLTSGGPASIVLALGELPIASDLTINGPGANLLTIDGGDASRIFNVDNGSSSSIDVEIVGLTLTGGNVVSGSGGAIYNEEDLTLSASTISGNSASTFGGAIYNVVGNLTITESTITGNEAFVGGGGVFTTGGNLQVTASTISGNRSLWFDGGGGGGIYAQFGPTTLTDSTLSGNMSQNRGGAILQYGYGAALNIINSTLSGNTAYQTGGGIYSRSGQLFVRHSTITGNQAMAQSNGGFDGGAGIWDASSPSELDHTIVAGNLGQSAFFDNDLHGGFSVRYSLIGRQTSDAFLMDNGGNLIGLPIDEPIDPQLGPLADNGGPTMTHALLTTSPAIDAGDPSFVGPPNYDQRGFAYNRVIGGRIDIGAFEFGAVSADFDEDGDVDGLDFLAWQIGFGIVAPNAMHEQGDADTDRDVDGADLSVWELQYATSPSPLVAFAMASVADDMIADPVVSSTSLINLIDLALAMHLADESIKAGDGDEIVALEPAFVDYCSYAPASRSGLPTRTGVSVRESTNTLAAAEHKSTDEISSCENALDEAFAATPTVTQISKLIRT